MYDAIKTASIFLFIILLASCGGEDAVPKPDAQLALNYPDPTYKSIEKDCSFSFDMNDKAVMKGKKDCSMTISYPDMDAMVYVNYRSVEENLRQLLIDGQKLSYTHNQMADAITEQPFVNPKNKTYGMFYEVEGDAASNIQFYVTDSVQNFLTASLYFNREPYYDSILPAVEYIKQDMVKMMESLQWKAKTAAKN
ncbi:gliding motility lipoprotein GldD [Nonlabens marinus]|uniref:Gliding motility protein GldD n=1 Tax=Nonlabens marinus S1-08 TaxID=1454201 RepID=W8VPX2_9FLAO|nr:gliding motility lipoprotein GldD [Nonlabens marinus]BAO54700.1 gliding motility protein GldD [Nonlabens marinus S1-08]